MRTRLLLLGLLIAVAGPALADDAVITAAQAAGTAGEQSDGYLGVHGAASADVRARVAQINIKRRAVYTDLAAKKGVSVTEIGGAAACQILDSVGEGQWYQDAGTAWRQRHGAIVKPSFCG
jgi:uncharacterized protein YdbL (DUF1318 family)